MSGKSNRKNKKKKVIDRRALYIGWQTKAIADAATAVNMADYGRGTDAESRLSLDAMEFALIFGWYLCPDI